MRMDPPPRELGLNYLIRLSAKNCLSRSARRTTLLLLDDPHPCLSRPVGGGVRAVQAGGAHKKPLDLSQHVQTYLFDRHALIRGGW